MTAWLSMYTSFAQSPPLQVPPVAVAHEESLMLYEDSCGDAAAIVE